MIKLISILQGSWVFESPSCAEIVGNWCAGRGYSPKAREAFIKDQLAGAYISVFSVRPCGMFVLVRVLGMTIFVNGRRLRG